MRHPTIAFAPARVKPGVLSANSLGHVFVARSAHRYNDTRTHVHALKCRNSQEYEEKVRLRGPKEVPLPNSTRYAARIFGADWVSLAVSRSWPKPLLISKLVKSQLLGGNNKVLPCLKQ